MHRIHELSHVDPKSLRAVAIVRIIHYIRMGDRNKARRLRKYFQKRGERLSREIAVAYEHLMHGCPSDFCELFTHGYRI